MTTRDYRTTSADGTGLAVQEWGNPDGPELLLIHGIAQSRLCFSRQTDSELAAGFRIVAFDLRGHGMSDKPADPAAYTDGRRWADDVAAVIRGAGLRRPVLVGWSLGGRVVAQFLDCHGDRGIAGLHFVGSRTVIDPARPTLGPGAVHLAAMQSADLETNVEGTSAFLRACVHHPLPPEEFSAMLAYNMLSPAMVRAATLQWPGDFAAALARVSVPTLVTHGLADRIILPAAAEITAGIVPAARLSWYPEIGHCPFREAPERFNAELADFARAAWAR